MSTRHSPRATPDDSSRAVAVIGMGCRFPGADGPAELWRLLSAGHDAITEVPASRFDIDAWYDPTPGTPNRIVSRGGGFLDQIDQFDAGYFGVAPREAEEMDPQQRLLLETAAEAIQDAGLTAARLRGGRAGVFIGAMASTYWEMLSRAGVLDVYAASGGSRAMLAGRVSYAFDLRGPSVSLDTACSSGLTALHLAYQAVRSGECALALAGGVNLVAAAEESVPFSSAKMLAPDGRCKFASADGDGFVRSEGVAVVVLKPLAAAEADGDAIYAVIHGSATGNDGQSGGYLMTPSQAGQEETLRAAYADAGVDPALVDYVEAHGTGTRAGDPVELSALGAVLGPGRPADRPALVGSIKTNIGHTEAASGLAGFIKAVLAIAHREIPASLHARTLTTAVDWSALPLRVVREHRGWPDTGRPALAAVSSFGISGTNSHLVLGEYQPASAARRRRVAKSPAHLLVLSAPDPRGLRALAERYRDFLAPGGEGHRLPLRDVCASAATRREHLDSRLSVVAGTAEEFVERLTAFLAGESRARCGSVGQVPHDTSTGQRPRTVFVYPGQGSQWDGMGRELLARYPVFRDTLIACDRAIRQETGWSVLDRLNGADAAPAGIDTVQPTLWAMQVGLSALLRSWGVRPDLVVGHSMGEVAAATAAGALSVPDGAAVICRRSRLLRRVAGQGAMLSVELTSADAQAAIAGFEDRVSVAVSNSPTSTVLSGAPDALAAIAAALDQRGVFCRPVKVDVASHSPQVDALRAELLAELAGLAPRAGEVPLYSTVDSQERDGSGLDAGYWVRNLREPVRFGDAVAALRDQGTAVFVEISPHPILLAAVREQLDPRGDTVATGCLRRDEPETAALLDTVGTLHRAGYPIDWSALYGEPAPTYLRLPRYPWQRQRYWFTPQPGAQPGRAAHPMVGTLLAQPDGAYRWTGAVDPGRHPYLADHKVQGTVVLPGTGYLEMVDAAARQLPGAGTPTLLDVHYTTALFYGPGPAPELDIELRPAGVPDRWSFTVSTVDDQGAGTEHARGQVELTPPAAPAAIDPAALRAGTGYHSGTEFYQRFARRGNEWVGPFQGIAELWVGPTHALGRIEVPDGVDLTGYRAHPALLDACGQVLAALMPDEPGAAAFVLGGIDRVVLHRPGRPQWSYVVGTPSWRSDSCTGDVLVAAADGTVLAELTGLRLQFLQPPGGLRDVRGLLYRLDWVPAQAAPGTAPAGRILVFADAAGTGAELARRLAGRAALVRPGDGYRQVAPGQYEIDPARPEDYRALLAGPPGGPPASVVHLWTADAVAGPDADPEALAAAQRTGSQSVLLLTQALTGTPGGPGRVLLGTRGAHRIGLTDRTASPAQATVWGLGRVIAQEHPELGCVLLDLDPAADPGQQAGALLAELAATGEDQVAVRAGTRWVARLRTDRPALPAPTGPRCHELRTDSPGLLDGLSLVPVPRAEPGPGQVEVRAEHLALNYRDVLLAMGRYPRLAGRPGDFMGECAGVVTRVGPGVAGLAPGDPVVAMAPGAPTRTHLLVDAHLVRRRPAGLTSRQAATLPVAFLTAYHSLIQLARLREGERVLIHHATGGVGLAAMQIARWKGAEVYATAGSPEKRALVQMMGATLVADSRTLDFAEQIMAATRGEGVHVVLNTLAGEGLARSLSVVAAGGRYVELSRRDLIDGTPLDMRLLARNISLFVVDVVELGSHQPRLAGEAIEEVLALVGQGVLTPLPHRVFPASQLVSAFRYLARAQQIGKVLIDVSTMDDEEPRPAVEPAATPPRPDPAASYLITGGLGEIGRCLVDWLVREGARHLVLTGRTPLPAGDPLPGRDATGPAGWLDALRRHGVDIGYEVVDVADETAMRALLERHRAQGRPPLRGVLHAAGVIEYRPVTDLTPAVLADQLRPKLLGGQVLNRVFRDEPLDFFVLFSSGSAVLSSPMLGGYAAANAALDALADQRRLAGQPALAVNWGFWSVGMPAREAAARGRPIHPQGMDTFTPREGVEVLRHLLARDATHAVVLAADWPQWSQAYPDAAGAPLLRRLTGREPEDPAAGEAPAPGAVQPGLPAAPSGARLEQVPEPGPPRPPVPPSGTAVPAGTPAATGAAEPAPVPPASTGTLASTGAGHAEPADRGVAGLAGALTDLPAAERYVRQVLAAVLGLPAAEVQLRRPIKRQGLDSLMAVEVRTRVQRDLGILLPIARMLGGQSGAELAADILTQLAGEPVPAAAG